MFLRPFKISATTWLAPLAATLALSGCGGGSNGPGTSNASTGNIVFASDRDGIDAIYRMKPDGTNVIRLTQSGSASDYQPSVSPDGSKILFVSFGRATDINNTNQIYVMNSDGSNVKRLTNSAGSNLDPTWSFDGRKILFDSTRDGNQEIYRMNTDGSEQTNLTNNPANDRVAIFNRDGSKIIFASTRDNANPTEVFTRTNRLYVMNSDGSNSQEFAPNQSPKPELQFPLQFSLDGTKILLANFSENANDSFPGLAVASADGTIVKQLALKVDNGAWSPDGKRIVYSGRVSFTSKSDIYTAKADGTDIKQLTDNSDNDSDPSWR